MKDLHDLKDLTIHDVKNFSRCKCFKGIELSGFNGASAGTLTSLFSAPPQLPDSLETPSVYRSTSLVRNRRPVGPYSRTMLRLLGGS